MPRFAFGSFVLDSESRTLLRDGERLALTGRTLDTLVVLLLNRGRLLDKDELLSLIWPGTVVEEANLSQSIFTLRKVLGDSRKDPRYIATIAGRGYQFIAPVTELANESPQPAASPAEGRPDIGSRSASVVENTKTPGRPRRMAIILVAAAVIALAAFALVNFHNRPGESVQYSLEPLTTVGDVDEAIVSPDGKWLAYTSGPPGSS